MADGIRIRPKPKVNVDQNGMVVVVDHSRPFRPPADGQALEDVQPTCPVCRVQHFAKTYHVQLVANHAMVSTTVWERLQSLRTPDGRDDNPFEMVNVVGEPPTIGIVPGSDKGPVLLEKYSMPIVTGGD